MKRSLSFFLYQTEVSLQALILTEQRLPEVHFTFYRYITNSQGDQLPVGLIAQLVEHYASQQLKYFPFVREIEVY